MSRFKTGLLCLWLLFGLNATALAQAPDQTTQISDDDWRAFSAVSAANSKAASGFQNQMLDILKTGKRDKTAFCDLTQKQAAAQARAADDEQAFLQKRKADGKPIDPMIKLYLGTASLADDVAIQSAEVCAEAQTGDETAQVVLQANALITAARQAETAHSAAVANGDTLVALRTLQSEGNYQGALVTILEELRDYGANYSPQAKALLAQLPAFTAKRDALKSDIKAHIKPYTDPQGKADAPYVYTPTVLPAIPDNDETFEKTFTMALMSAEQPMLQAVSAITKGDAATGCQLSQNSDAEITRLHDFAQAYMDQQAAAGKTSAAGEKALTAIKTIAAQSADLVQKTCAKATSVAAQKSEIETIINDMRTLQPKFISAAQAMNASAKAHDAVGTCANSTQVLELMDRMIKDLERLIELASAPIMTNAQTAQLDTAKSSLATLKAQRANVLALNKASCPAKRK